MLIKKILILVPSTKAQGGISNYYKSLTDHFSDNVEYFVRGSRTWPIRKNIFVEGYRIISDIIRFCFVLLSRKYYLVQANTSIGHIGLLRDGIFIWISKLFSLKTIVFFRGLHEDYQDEIENKYLGMFKYLFFPSNGFIVLSEKFKKRLIQWGYNKPIYLETTLVDDKLIKDINKDFIDNKYKVEDNDINILFLARVEKEKGIYEAIATIKILNSVNNNLKLLVAGEGFELKNAQKYVAENKIKNITFLGFVKDKEKISTFKNSHIYLFPSYTEGMPTSVLEAMAFGIPVITRAVGGLTDFFKNEANGYITESKDPKELAKYIGNLISNRELMKKIALNNYQYALNNFLSSIIAKRLENIYKLNF